MNLRKVSEINSISNPRLRRAIPLLLGTIVALSLFLTAIPVASASLGSWSATTTYPTGIHDQSCVVDSSFVYCVGGAGYTNAVYFALLSPSGVGPWSATTNYPTIIAFQSCVASSGFVYCIGGNLNVITAAVYFAPLSSSGVGL